MSFGFLVEWQALAERVGIDAGAARAIGTDLLARHGEPQRHYHTAEHIEAVIANLGQLATTTPVTLAAAFFHDAIYEPTRTDNETRSAQLARRVLGDSGADVDIDRVAAIIEATAGHPTDSADADGEMAAFLDADGEMAAFLDADLAILGSSTEDYDRYAAQIRREYAHLDDASFAAGRAAVLEGFVDRDRLFVTLAGAARWEARARANLTREISRLRRSDRPRPKPHPSSRSDNR